MLHRIKRSLSALLVLSSVSAITIEPVQASHRFDHLGEGIYLSTECDRSRVIGFDNTTVTATVIANGQDETGQDRSNQRLSEVFLLGRDPVSDRAIRVIERYQLGKPKSGTYTRNLRGVSAERVEIVDGSIKVTTGRNSRDIIVDVPAFTLSCD